MKRFNVTNRSNGLTFKVQGESLESIYPAGLPKAWGKPERWVSGFNLTEEEKLQAIETRVGQGGLGEEVIEYKLAAEFTITEENIDAEINAKIAKKERLDALKDKAAAYKNTDLDTVVELRQAYLELLEILGIK